MWKLSPEQQDVVLRGIARHQTSRQVNEALIAVGAKTLSRVQIKRYRDLVDISDETKEKIRIYSEEWIKEREEKLNEIQAADDTELLKLTGTHIATLQKEIISLKDELIEAKENLAEAKKDKKAKEIVFYVKHINNTILLIQETIKQINTCIKTAATLNKEIRGWLGVTKDDQAPEVKLQVLQAFITTLTPDKQQFITALGGAIRSHRGNSGRDNGSGRDD